MQRRKKTEDAQSGIEPGLIPVLSCMFLLIPALLLAMQAARWSAISVAVPAYTGNAGAPPHLERHVFAVVHIHDGELVAGFGTRANPSVEVFPWDGDRFDAAGLEAWAARVAAEQLTAVEVSADGAVPLRAVVRAMDALRGQHCDLRGVVAGESTGEGCYLWQPEVESAPRSQLRRSI